MDFSTESTATEKVAAFISKTKYNDIPKEAGDAAKKAIIDYLGVALAGSAEPVAKTMIELVKKSGAKSEAGVIGGGI